MFSKVIAKRLLNSAYMKKEIDMTRCCKLYYRIFEIPYWYINFMVGRGRGPWYYKHFYGKIRLIFELSR